MDSPLQTQTIPLSFVGGIDSKTDSRQTPVTKLQVLQNAAFTRPKSLVKRNGYRALNKTIANPSGTLSEIEDGRALTTLSNELVLCDPTRLYSYDASNEQWIDKGANVSVGVTQFPVVRDTFEQTAQDGVTHSSGLQCYVWRDSSGGCRYSVIDGTTGQTVVGSTLIDSTGFARKPKVVVFGNFFVLWWVDVSSAAVLKAATIAVLNPTAPLVPTMVTAGAGGGFRTLHPTACNYDVMVASDASPPQMYLAFNNSNSDLSIYSFQSVPPAAPSVIVTVDTVSVNVVSIFEDTSNGGPVVLWYDGTSIFYQSWSPFVSLLSVPQNLLLASTTGGTLTPTNTYTYQVTATNSLGETTPTPTLGRTPFSNAILATWDAVPGATGYNVYGNNSLLIGLLTGVTTNSFIDNGSYTHGVAPPTINTTYGAQVTGGNLIRTVADVITLTGVSVNDAMAWEIFYTTQSTMLSPRFASVHSASIVSDVVVSLGNTAGAVSLAGKAIEYNGVAYVPLAYESPLDSTFFVADQNGNIIVRCLVGLGGGVPFRDTIGSPMLPEFSPVVDGEWRVSALIQDFLTTFPSTTVTGTPTTATYTQTGVTAITVNFAETANSYLHSTLGNSLMLSGGFIQQYDGVSPIELGFHYYPEIVASDVVISNTGGALGNATQASSYWWVVTYEWTDNTGALHRSEPSVPVNKTVNSAVVTATATITLPYLQLTAKRDPRTPLTLNVYRTIGTSPGVFYLAQNTNVPTPNSTGTNQPMLNDLTRFTCSFIDKISDSDLIGNPRLYTTGGVLENGATNSIGSMTVFQNRVFGIDTTNPLVLWYSQQVLAGSPVEFCSFLTMNIDPKIGGAVALGVIDEKLIIFGSSSIFYVNGQGPDSTGANNSYQDPQLVTTDVGCTNPHSVVLTSDGIMFQSAKGIYLLARDLSASYLGADVEQLTDGQIITSSQQLQTQNQLRFTLDSGQAVVFDTFVGQWSAFTPIAATDSAIWQGQFTYLQSNGLVLQETPGIYSDNGRAITMALTTAPIRLTGLSGFQRVREFVIQGLYESPHQLLISVQYDGNPAATQTVQAIPITPSVWGSDAFWGSGTPWGGSYQPYLWRVLTNTQKCESIQITIKDAMPNIPPGEGMALSGITLEIAAKAGAWKLPASSTSGG